MKMKFIFKTEQITYMAPMIRMFLPRRDFIWTPSSLGAAFAGRKRIASAVAAMPIGRRVTGLVVVSTL